MNERRKSDDLTGTETHIIDRMFLQHNPPVHPEVDLYRHVLGTIVTKIGYWMLIDKRTNGPVFGHA